MTIPDYTTVITVDENHLHKLSLVWPTWVSHKPSLLNHPLLVIFDAEMSIDGITAIVKDHPSVTYQPWPPESVKYENFDDSRFGEAQRYKMLSGFVHVPAKHVFTPYWLKIDLDTVAIGQNDWIEPSWFAGSPVIIASPWGYTKPPDQMLRLDQWLNYLTIDSPWRNTEPLNLIPRLESDLVRHQRIISWVGFFNTEFTRDCSDLATAVCGTGKLPVPSQDGFHWYLAERGGRSVKRVRMKSRGWVHCGSEQSIRDAIQDYCWVGTEAEGDF